MAYYLPTSVLMPCCLLGVLFLLPEEEITSWLMATGCPGLSHHFTWRERMSRAVTPAAGKALLWYGEKAYHIISQAMLHVGRKI